MTTLAPSPSPSPSPPLTPSPPFGSRPTAVADLLRTARWGTTLSLGPEDRRRMETSRASLTALAARRPVYGLTRGFGPLVDYEADQDPHVQGTGLLDHLTAGQGPALPPEVTRTMVLLRLRGMLLGHSAVAVEVWEALAAQWNAGFTPVVPQDGSLSASGDLVPLAHAAQAAAGRGAAWQRTAGGDWEQVPAERALRDLGLPAVRWDARSALAFANGTSASLARALHNHARLDALTRAVAVGSGHLAGLLGSSPEPYDDRLSAVRRHPGQRRAAAVIREARDAVVHDTGAARRLQEPYSLRCAPQVVGAVLDQLSFQGAVLATEGEGTTDNPVFVDGDVLHGGNFHAAPVALAGEQHMLCLHQLAYLAERQLHLVLDPQHNGGLPPMLTPAPGRQSGLAGVQIAAGSHLGAIRQHGYPASFTPVPTNLGNQDHVPLALNGANAVSGALDRAWWIVASLYMALTQYAHLGDVTPPAGIWAELAADWIPLDRDRPLADEVADTARRVERHFTTPRER
ncbi:aromatic amino acid ammonia-lyase [Streptomyces sp. NPDC089915]|uniref:aromatic amino acid ammonia-lyase n=1 Tax=Streptomyces sp. NPDC089915 TaxID=3155186 RepID=UPI00341D8597